MPEKRTKYDREFREGAVRIVNETSKPIAVVARDLGVNEGTLGNWVARDREARQGTDGLSKGDIQELKRLRAEVAELRMERDVLIAIRGPVGEGGDEVSVARFIADQRTFYRVPHTGTCLLLGVSSAWFYKWAQRQQPGPHTPTQRRRGEVDTAVGKGVRRRAWAARLASLARRSAGGRLGGVGEDGGRLDAPPRPGRAADQAP